VKKNYLVANRISYIDGLRGLAILAVVFYHAYSRWSSIEPFDQNGILQNLFSYGWLGVQLFFGISGYVIYMTILKTNNFFMFGLARYLRLAPAMLIAACLIYTTAFFIVERPLGAPSLIDFIPSLTFVQPGVFNEILGTEMRSLDGVFWSLYVEVKFYFIVAFLFYIVGDKKLKGLNLLFMIWCIFAVNNFLVIVNNSYTNLIFYTLNVIGVNYYGWFLLGVIAYKYQVDKTKRNAFLLLAMLIVAVLSSSFEDIKNFLPALITASIFIAPFFIEKARELLSSEKLLFVGYISYPLFLIHQNIVTGLAIKLHAIYPNLPAFVYPIPFILIVIFISYLIANLEPKFRKSLKNIFPNKFFGYQLKRTKLKGY